MNSVAIIGYGFVGKAIANGIKSSVNIYKIDPKLGTDINVIKNNHIKIIFICLPTPMDDNGGQDISIILNVIKKINEINDDFIIVLKSTVLPNFVKDIENSCKNFVYNPEFLTEKNANEDFINSDLIIFGGEDSICKKLSKFYDIHTKCINKNYIYTDAISASLVKYSINSFLASKVLFFNGIRKIFDKMNSDETWESFISILKLDERLGETHMSVPGPDKKFGFGGACLPKDISALYNYSTEIDEEFKLLKKIIDLNKEIRISYNLDSRELEQNINYKKRESL